MNKKFSLIFIPLLGILFSCNQRHDENKYTSKNLLEITEQINSIKAGDTLDLNLVDLNFDNVALLSHEIYTIKLRKKSDNQIFDMKSGNWGIAWLKDSLIIQHIEFSPEKLMFDNLVGGDGYEIIKRNELKKMLIVQTSKKFVNSDSVVLDVKVLD